MLDSPLAIDAQFITSLTFPYSELQRDKFKAGELGEQWAKRYPELFDKDDLRIYRNQCENGYHFFEWLAAIIIFEATGYRCLIEKYGCPGHKRKLPIWESIAPLSIQNLPFAKGWPDLFAYLPDGTDWFFCETKGKDRLSDAQRECFNGIYKESGKPVYTLRFVQQR